MFKKFLALLLTGAMTVGVLAGCGSAGENAPAAEPKAETTKTPEAAENETEETAKPAESDSEETLEVGIVMTLSSTHAATNGWLMASIESGVKIINEEHGGINGKKITYTLYDPESDGATLKQRLTDIKNSGAICAIVGVGDALTPAAAQWASENEFPVFLGSNTSTQITLGNYSDYAYSMGKNAWGFAKVLALACVGEEKIENFSFVGTDGAATIDAENFLLYEGQKINPDFKMLDSYRINFNDTEFSNIIAAATSKNPQMILQQGGGPNFVSFCQQASLFGLFDFCDVYNDLVTDASTNQPLIEGNEFPYGSTHGVFSLPFWDMESVEDEDLRHFIDVWNESDFAKEGWIPGDVCVIQYYVWKIIETAGNDILSSGGDIHDPKAFAAAISGVNWEDGQGKHYFRTGIDNQWTYPMYYGTSSYSDEWPAVAICEKYKAYSPEEFLPTAEEMKTWGAENGYDVSRFE